MLLSIQQTKWQQRENSRQRAEHLQIPASIKDLKKGYGGCLLEEEGLGVGEGSAGNRSWRPKLVPAPGSLR